MFRYLNNDEFSYSVRMGWVLWNVESLVELQSDPRPTSMLRSGGALSSVSFHKYVRA